MEEDDDSGLPENRIEDLLDRHALSPEAFGHIKYFFVTERRLPSLVR
jgi:hypothetical protein